MSKETPDIMLKDVDLEKGHSTSSFTNEAEGDSYVEAEVQHTKGNNILQKIAYSLNAEVKGIDRISEEERNPKEGVLNAASMWFSANMVIASLALGMLGGGVLGLSFWEAVLTIIFFNLLGLLPVAFFSTFGPEFGLRQMILTRFFLGDIGSRIFAFINCVACVGWGAVNIMVSAQLLHMINPGHHQLPPFVACIILIVCTIAVTFFGYKAIHLYEKWAWVPNFMVFLVLIARLKISGNFSAGEFTSGSTTAGGVLSFGGAIFGFASGWTTYAADYTVYIPKHYSKLKIFLGLIVGLAFPLIFTMILGAAIVTGVEKDAVWAEYYDKYQNGGLIFAVLSVNSVGGFGQFCCVILAMSTVSNNIPNMYSIALGAQSFYSKFAVVPRAIWTIAGNFLTLAICIPAYYHFESVMDNFMNIIGYYLSIYIAMSLSEHFIYRKGFGGYNPDDWNDKKKYPIGFAALFGFCCGVAGCVVGMDQTWYVGPIGKKIGEYGGDIGFELALSFSFIGFNLVRPFELKYFGR